MSLRRRSSWSRALGLAWPDPTRWSAFRQSFLVLEDDGVAFRLAHARRRGREIELLGLESCRELEELRGLLPRFGCPLPQSTVLVSAKVTPDLVATKSSTAVLGPDWRARFTALGMRLERVYPLLGCPLLALELAPSEPVLFLQVERSFLAAMELVDGRPTDVEVIPAQEPIVRRCRALVGEACPEVLLAGGGADLSFLGYELTRAGTTWVRILRPTSGAELTPPTSLSAIVGAARHFSGLVCFLPSDVRADRPPPLPRERFMHRRRGLRG